MCGHEYKVQRLFLVKRMLLWKPQRLCDCIHMFITAVSVIFYHVFNHRIVKVIIFCSVVTQHADSHSKQKLVLNFNVSSGKCRPS